MALKTLVKVGNITNLSDARYCSGMGVDMLGFTVVEEKSDYITPSLFQEIRGWISGPSVVACLYGLQNGKLLESILSNYAPDFLEVHIDQFSLIQSSSLPVIVSLQSGDELNQLDTFKDRIAYVQIPEKDKKIITQISYPVICEIQSGQDVADFIDQYKVKGIALSGSPEVRPGFKDYGDLADVLEQLEED